MRQALAYAAAAALQVTPGYAVLPLISSSGVRPLGLPSAIVLSPFVTAVATLLLTFLGVPFRAILGVVIAAGSIFCCVVSYGRNRRRNIVAASFTSSVDPTLLVCLAALIVPIVVAWVAVPMYRVYGWHNFMQMAAMSQLRRLPALPEDMDFAGVRLNYPWMGNIHLALTSEMIHVAPTAVYPILNVATLIAFFILIRHSIVVCGLVSPPWASAGACFAVLGSDLGMSVARFFHVWKYFLTGELRAATLVPKFVAIDANALGLSILAVMLSIAAVALWADPPKMVSVAAAPFLVLAVGLVYPVLVPAAVLGALPLAVCGQTRRDTWWMPSGRVRLLVILVGIAGALMVTIAYVRAMTPVGGKPLVDLAGWKDVRRHVISLAVSMLPLLVAASAQGRRWADIPAWPRIGCGIPAIGCFALYLFTSLPTEAEYKYLMAGLLFLAPIVGLLFVPKSYSVSRVVGSVAALGLSAACYAWLLIRFSLPNDPSVNDSLAAAVPVTERHAQVSTSGETGWIGLLRQQTDPATVVVAPPSDLPLPVLLDRSLYIASDRGPFGRAGYSMRSEFMLQDLRGYSVTAVESRLDTLNLVYAPDGEAAQYPGVTARLESLNRPVAIVFTQSAPYLAWLRLNAIGRSIGRFDNGEIWLLG